MSARPFDDPEENQREDRIEELQHRAHELTGGEMIAGGAAESPPEVREQFWEHVLAWEEAPWTTDFLQLQEAGIALPAPDTLDDDQVSMAGLLIVHGVMLHIADHALFLKSLHFGAHEFAGQNGVLAFVPLIAQLAADERAVLASNRQVPARGLRDSGGQRNDEKC
jgi:hypothetical protein